MHIADDGDPGLAAPDVSPHPVSHVCTFYLFDLSRRGGIKVAPVPVAKFMESRMGREKDHPTCRCN